MSNQQLTRPSSLRSVPTGKAFTGAVIRGAGWVLWGILLLVLVGFFDVPMLWLVFAPSKTDAALVQGNPLSFGSLGNYVAAFDHLWHYNGGQVPVWFFNSVLYSVSSVVLALVLSIPAGYAISVFRFKGRQVVLIGTLIALALPSAATVLPLFLEMGALRLLNNPLSVILPSSFSPFGVYLSYTYFSSTLPPEILDSGRVDGGSEVRVFRSLALPLAKPVVALVAFFTFTAQWNNFFLVTVMLSSEARMTLQVGLSYIMAAVFSAGSTQTLTAHVERPELTLAALLLALPVMIFFVVIQRYLLRGLLAGYGIG